MAAGYGSGRGAGRCHAGYGIIDLCSLGYGSFRLSVLLIFLVWATCVCEAAAMLGTVTLVQLIDCGINCYGSCYCRNRYAGYGIIDFMS